MEYKKYKLGEIASFTQGKQVNINEQFFVKKEGMKRFVRIVDYTNSNEPIRYVKNFGKRYYVSSDEVAMIRYGSQTAGMVVLGKDGIIANNLFKISINNEIALNKYIFYFLSQKFIFNYLRKSQSSSTMPAISFNIMNNLEIYIPNKECQRKIVKILSDIDKNILLNNEINNNLYEVGIELLKKDFTIEKEKKSLVQVIKFVKGKKPKYIIANKQEGYEKYLTIACLNGQELNYADTTKMIMSNNDLLMVMDGASSGEVYYGGKGIVGSTLSRIDCIDNNYISEFIFFVLKYYKDLIKSKNTGSAIPHTDKVFVGSLEIPKFDIETQEKYKVILSKIQHNQNKNKTLKQLRDTLLTKLMNGEINLDNIEF